MTDGLAPLSLDFLHALKARVGGAARARVEAEIARRIAPPAEPVSEKDFEAQVIAECTRLGFDVVKLSQPQRPVGMTEGIPDLYLRHPRRRLRLWCEVKAPDGRIRPAQKRWHAAEREAGGEVITVWTMADLYDEMRARGFEVSAEIATPKSKGAA